MAKFKKSTLDLIGSDPDLFCIVCKKMGVKPTTLASNLPRNSNSLNNYAVVEAVCAFLGKDAKELLEVSEELATVKG